MHRNLTTRCVVSPDKGHHIVVGESLIHFPDRIIRIDNGQNMARLLPNAG